MECAHIKREEVVERYLTGTLVRRSENPSRSIYFACEQCFAALQAHRALQAELSASAPQIRAMPAPNPTAWRWTAAMATAAVVNPGCPRHSLGHEAGLVPPRIGRGLPNCLNRLHWKRGTGLIEWLEATVNYKKSAGRSASTPGFGVLAAFPSLARCCNSRRLSTTGIGIAVSSESPDPTSEH